MARAAPARDGPIRQAGALAPLAIRQAGAGEDRVEVRADLERPAQRIVLEASLSDPQARSAARGVYRYHVEIGFPQRGVAAAFDLEPQVKEEWLSYDGGGRQVRLVDRRGPSVMARNEAGRPVEVDIDLLSSETVLGRLEDPGRYPMLDMVRRINADGTAVVIVEQSVTTALSLVDRAYFMEKGEVRFDGPAADLIDRHDLLRAVFLEGAAKGVVTA